MDGERTDFFVSHAGADRAWAEWVAWQLIEAGYTVELDVWDWAAGRNFVTAISDALEQCDRVVALFSVAYFDRDRYTTEEWSASVLHVPGMEQGRLVPVRVEDVPLARMPAVLRPLVYRDIFGMDEGPARQVLLDAVAGPRRPDRKPPFPAQGMAEAPGRSGGPVPRLPGSVPRVWNIPARNPGFTGRDGLLVAVRERLLAGDRAVVQALHGMAGVGKTQLATEYAHQFGGTYDLAWWINSERAGLIGDQFAALGTALACIQPDADTEAVQAAVLGELRVQGRWLLVFDNAANPTDIAAWLPGGQGHVLITSRERTWAEVAALVEVDVLARSESVAMLQDRVPGLSDTNADQIAGQLGDLPLALAQAAGFMAETGTPASMFLDLLETQTGQLLDQSAPGSYPRSLAATTQLTVDQLDHSDAAAGDLVRICAFLAPEPIPEDLFSGAASELPGDLGARAADPLAWRQTLAQLTRQSLVRLDHGGLVMHRLTQAIVRDRLSAQSVIRERTEAVLAASDPGDPGNPSTWPRWAQLMPHLLAIDPAATGNPRLRQMACSAGGYLIARGDTHAGHDLMNDLRQHWRERLGEDDEHVREATSYLAWALRIMGRYPEARDLDQENLDRNRRLMGADDPNTLVIASDLAADLYVLRELQAGHDLEQDTLERSRKILGEDHPSTLASAGNLAAFLFGLGKVEAARDLEQVTLNRRRQVLGENHPDTLASASNLAGYLRLLGDLRTAHDLDQDTLNRRRQVLGEDHPSTLASTSNLAEDVRLLDAAKDDK